MSQAEQTYREIFKEVLDASDETVSLATYGELYSWGSLNHLILIDRLEAAFGISFGREDILFFTSYSAGLEILRKAGIAI